MVPCKTEEEIYARLDLAYVPPELREDHGEFAAAEKNELPRLLEWTELRGSLHNHSNWSDGRCKLEDIAAHMRELGCGYWAITDLEIVLGQWLTNPASPATPGSQTNQRSVGH
jgi:DNA polymerase (family 10)